MLMSSGRPAVGPHLAHGAPGGVPPPARGTAVYGRNPTGHKGPEPPRPTSKGPARNGRSLSPSRRAAPCARRARWRRPVRSAGWARRRGSTSAGGRRVGVKRSFLRAIGARARGQRPVVAPARAGARAGARAIGCLLGLLEGGPVSVAWLFIESIKRAAHLQRGGLGDSSVGVGAWRGGRALRLGDLGDLEVKGRRGGVGMVLPITRI